MTLPHQVVTVARNVLLTLADRLRRLDSEPQKALPATAHRGRTTSTNNPAMDAWMVATYGSASAAAAALGIKRTTLLAWCHGRSRAPEYFRHRMEQLSEGAVTNGSWNDASNKYRAEVRHVC